MQQFLEFLDRVRVELVIARPPCGQYTASLKSCGIGSSKEAAFLSYPVGYGKTPEKAQDDLLLQINNKWLFIEEEPETRYRCTIWKIPDGISPGQQDGSNNSN